MKKEKTRFKWEDWGLKERNSSSKSSPNLKVSLKKSKKDKKNMRQLKVREIIEEIERTEESVREEREKIEKQKERKPQMMTATASSYSTTTSSSSSGSRTQGITPKEGRKNEKLELGAGTKKDGGKFVLRTSLRNTANLMKKEEKNWGR